MTADLMIDQSDIEIADVELLAHPGSRGMPEFAASSCDTPTICQPGGCSCTSSGATERSHAETTTA
jgi:hypothetical protein